jgi:hypothetical protein
MGGKIWPDPHFAIAKRTPPCGTPDSICWASLWYLRSGSEKLSGNCQKYGSPGIREESELPDANEAARQNVLGKAAQKLRRFQGHLALLVAMCVVFPPEGDLPSVENQ